MKKIMLIAIFISLYMLHPSAASAQTPPPPSYVPSQVIVQFNQGFAPADLEKAIAQKQALKKTFVGSVKLFFAQIVNSFRPTPSPEQNLKNIKDAEKKVHVVDTSRMFDGIGESQNGTFLYTLDEEANVQDAVKVFEALSEVKYAQPNYLYGITEVK